MSPESWFWLRLEYGVFEGGGEMEAAGRPEIDDWWYDGIEPDTYEFDSETPHISGVFWTGADVDKKWRFRLELTNLPRVRAANEIDWEAMYPKPGQTGWLTVDLEEELIQMDFSIRDQPSEDTVLRRSYPASVIPHHVPTPEADIVSGDAWRTPRTIVHRSAPPLEARNAVTDWAELRSLHVAPGKKRFWQLLEHRIWMQLGASGRSELTAFKPDGIAIDCYEVAGPAPRITGWCWFRRRPRLSSRPLEGPALDRSASLGPYRFVVDLGPQTTATSPGELDFEALLPDEAATGWLTVDTTRMVVAVDPSIREQSDEDILVNLNYQFRILRRDEDDESLRSGREWQHERRRPRTLVHHDSSPPPEQSED